MSSLRDDTTLPALDPGHPVAAYIFSEDPKSERSACHLKGFRGLLQLDGYAGFGRLVAAAGNEMPPLAFCWALTRRKFYDIHAATKSRLAGRRCGGSPLSRAPSWCCSKRSAGSELTITSFRCAVAPTRFRLSIPMKLATQPRDGKCAGQFRRHDVPQFHIIG
jgi:hypothetical protein